MTASIVRASEAQRRNFRRLVAIALAYILFLGGPLLAWLGWTEPLHGFMIMAASAIPSLASVLICMIDTLKRRDPKASWQAAVAAIPLLVIGIWISRSSKHPRINDISTDLDNPPRFVVAQTAGENRGKDLTYPEDFKPVVREYYPDLLSLQKRLPPRETFDLVRKTAARHQGWHVARIDVASMTIEGSATSSVFRFKDDFVIRVQELDNGSQIDMRSRSRVGKGDLGTNAERIKGYFAQLEVARP